MKFGRKLPHLIVSKKTGFRNVTGNPVIILDQRGEVFYDTSKLDKRIYEFNLPQGEYYILCGKIREMPMPVRYELAPLPPIQRDMGVDPATFEVIFADNKFTGTIAWNEQKVVLDNRLKNYPLPTLRFIFEHERGHRYWDENVSPDDLNEEACDRYASNEMLKAGYNPSQIGDAMLSTLSDDKVKRKKIMIESLVNKPKSLASYG